ncbi:hypothetical protein [Stella sp.]|uniref:hypothetical protein n=1 Tax=Stella sp. TaxID=2912054 RepID=UPI0035ADADEB
MRAARGAALAAVLAAGVTGAATAQQDAVWLALSIGSADRAFVAEVDALRDGRRLALVATAGRDRGFPVPGFVPAAPTDLDRGIAIAAARDRTRVLTLRRTGDGAFVLLDRDGAVVSVPVATGTMPVIGLQIPLELVRPALRAETGEGADEVAARRGFALAPPMRVAAVGGDVAWMARSHRAGVRHRQTAPLGVPLVVFRPGSGFVSDDAPGPAMLPVGLGTDLGARWLFSSTPAGATVAFDGLAGQVATEVGVRNLPASALRSLVMRKDGYRDCRHADARLDVVVRGGLEWNSVHCRLVAAGG